ncbi:MAG TPA: hypothetical protein VF921_19750 [Vicinamibacterales bacterium]
MLRDIAVLLSCGAMSYVWLCVIASPLVNSARSLIRRGTDRTAWAALGLALAGAILWTTIIAGVILLAMMLEPRAGLALLRTGVEWRGVSLGNVVWICQFLAFARVPRVGPTIETATALAIVALVRDDPRTLSRVERLYRAHAVTIAPAEAAVSGGVRGIAA